MLEDKGFAPEAMLDFSMQRNTLQWCRLTQAKRWQKLRCYVKICRLNYTDSY